jgi:hydroxyacylglutathione hydrolase
MTLFAFLAFCPFNPRLRCLATPCHTQDSICYHVTDVADGKDPGGVFTGDTLFIAGSGRFFEGVGSEMVAALDYLGSLPNETIVYNGHEYTAGSLAFGKHIDPSNPGLERLAEITQKNKVTTGLTTIGDEKEWNVFMRLDSEAVMLAFCHLSFLSISPRSTEKQHHQRRILPRVLSWIPSDS